MAVTGRRPTAVKGLLPWDDVDSGFSVQVRVIVYGRHGSSAAAPPCSN